MPGYFEFKYMKWFISFFWWHVTGSFMSFIKKRFSLVTWLIKAEKFITQDMHVGLLQSAMDSYYKMQQLFYYKVWHGLLQFATGITKCDEFITNCDRYYKLRWIYHKLRQVLQSAMNLLQIATGITKSDDCYKLRQYTTSFKNFLALFCISLKRLERIFLKSLYIIFIMYIIMSKTFVKIDLQQHLDISRQTYPTNRSKICVTTFTVLTFW